MKGFRIASLPPGAGGDTALGISPSLAGTQPSLAVAAIAAALNLEEEGTGGRVALGGSAMNPSAAMAGGQSLQWQRGWLQAADVASLCSTFQVIPGDLAAKLATTEALAWASQQKRPGHSLGEVPKDQIAARVRSNTARLLSNPLAACCIFWRYCEAWRQGRIQGTLGDFVNHECAVQDERRASARTSRPSRTPTLKGKDAWIVLEELEAAVSDLSEQAVHTTVVPRADALATAATSSSALSESKLPASGIKVVRPSRGGLNIRSRVLALQAQAGSDARRRSAAVPVHVADALEHMGPVLESLGADRAVGKRARQLLLSLRSGKELAETGVSIYADSDAA